jgi:ATP-binding cassette subfamily B protein
MFQKERIREFINGSMVTTLLNLSMIIIVLPILFVYSWKLALFVVTTFNHVTLTMVLAVKILRYRMTQLQRAGSEKNRYLVETLCGMNTAKSLALEQQRFRRIDMDSHRLFHEIFT